MCVAGQQSRSACGWLPGSARGGSTATPRPACVRSSARAHPRVLCARAATKQELQRYLGEHQIQERLNDWLNDMVKERPSTPYSYLATRMRSGASAAAPPQDSIPVLGAAAAQEAFSDLTRQWAYSLSFQGMTVEAAAPASAGAELVLSIEPSPDAKSLVLSVRPK